MRSKNPSNHVHNLVTEEEMKGVKWLEEKAKYSGTMDTYMDTKAIY